jgi:hypothetical protein
MYRPDPLFDSSVVVFQSDDVILTEIIAKLHFNNFEWTITAIAQTVICLERDMNVLALTELQFLRATHDVCYAFDYDPVLLAPRVALQAEAGAGLYLKHLNLEPGLFFQDFVTAPRPLVRLAHSAGLQTFSTNRIPLSGIENS